MSGATGAPSGTQMFGTTTVPRGTSAFVGKNANVHAGRNVDLDARERVDVKAVGGGFGVGGIGVGAGIVIVSLDERVQAFVDSGARISAAEVTATGDVTVDARLRANMSGLGVALGGALIVGVAAAVVVITDTSEVGAYLADAGTVPAAGNRCDDDADNVCILSADAVSLTADRTSTLHASTFGIAIAGIAAVGAAVAVAEVKGSTTAYIGKGAQLGRSGIGQSVGSVGASRHDDRVRRPVRRLEDDVGRDLGGNPRLGGRRVSRSAPSGRTRRPQSATTC